MSLKKTTNGHQHKKQESSSSSSDDDDGPIRAPIQLKLEVGKTNQSNKI
jgi:hypothetical protein